MPPSENFIREYSGTSQTDLLALVDNTLAIHGKRVMVSEEVASQFGLSAIDQTTAVLRGYLAPELFLADALTHIANRVMDEGDVQAWYEIKEIQECIFEGKAEECRNCGELEGRHYSGTYCRKQREIERGPNALSLRFERKV